MEVSGLFLMCSSFYYFQSPYCLASYLPSVFTLNLEVCHRVRCLLNVLLNVKQALDFVFVAQLQGHISVICRHAGLTRWRGDYISHLLIALVKYLRQATQKDFVYLTYIFGGSRHGICRGLVLCRVLMAVLHYSVMIVQEQVVTHLGYCN